MTGPRLVLAEDDVLLREGLASLLGHSGYDVVGQAGDGTRLIALARETRPDVVVADVRMPPTHTTEGLEAARVIRQERGLTAMIGPRRVQPCGAGEHAGAGLRRQ